MSRLRWNKRITGKQAVDYRRPTYTPPDDLQRQANAVFDEWAASLSPKDRRALTSSLPIEVTAMKRVNRRMARRASDEHAAIQRRAREILKGST